MTYAISSTAIPTRCSGLESTSPRPIASAKHGRKNPRSRRTALRFVSISDPVWRRLAKPSADAAMTSIATVDSMKGAPTIAPIATCSPSAPASTATMGMTDSGRAVPTAAITLPTAPSPRLSRWPAHSTAFVNSTAPAMISTKETIRSRAVTRDRCPRHSPLKRSRALGTEGKDRCAGGAKRGVIEKNANPLPGSHPHLRALTTEEEGESGSLMGVDVDAAEDAAAALLRSLGADLDEESLRGTPRRIAALYAELLSPAPFRPTTFP